MKRRKKHFQKAWSIALIILLLISTFSHSNMPIIKAEEKMNNQTLRIHYETDVENVTDLGVWLWGDVAAPSEEQGEWPNGTWFTDEQVTNYGPYVDVELKEEAKNIGLKINNRVGEEITDDITVEMISSQIEEVWITKEGNVYYYNPSEIDENMVRIHYWKDNQEYEPWGVWTWGDVLNPSQAWSMDAVPFSNEQMGPYGAYVDIPLKESAESLGLLLVTRDEAANKTGDMTFEDLSTHRQLFIKEGTDELFTNPYYVSTEEKEEAPVEVGEGEHDIEVTAEVSDTFTYNEHSLLTVNISNPSDIEITSIYADTSSLGGSSKLEISPELQQVTLSVTHDIVAGEKTIPITVVDADNGAYHAEATAIVEARDISAENMDWDESIIYFMLTDRFYDGNQANNDPYGIGYDSYENQRGVYQGGDFKGIIKKLDYLDELGINTIWISPIVENVGYDVNYNAEEGAYFAYHGYWANNFEALNPHFGTLEEFHQLIDEAAKRDIHIMVDVVLNHTGYGLKESDASIEGEPPAGYPTNEERERFKDMIREKSGSGDEKMELSGLPDFKTEDEAVRNQIVDWQTAWLDKSTTANGNSISYFRVDTVKHVDRTTWQHFRNELTKKDPAFQLIGEAWGAGANNNQGYLETGTMDSLLDFEFKTIARNFVNGQLEQANESLIARNGKISNQALLGQFLGSHDEDGFLYSLNGDEGKLKLAASLQITAKGQPVIYYGEELGQTGKNNWPEYDNRYDLAWDNVENNDILEHYQKLLQFRNNHSDILAKGNRAKIAGSNEDEYLLFERSFDNEKVYVGLNTSNKEKIVTLTVSDEETIVTDEYANRQFDTTKQEDGSVTITVEIPSMDNGGTVLLSAANGSILGESSNESGVEEEETPAIQDGYLRVHFPGNNDNFTDLGLWIWEDVETPSEQNGSWPNGATTITNDKRTDYGPYVDIKLAKNAKKIGFLINDSQGANLSGDKFVDIVSPEMNEIWLTEDYNVYLYEPLPSEDNKIRVNFLQKEDSYENFGLWTWGDVLNPTEDWPNGAHFFSDDQIGLKGSYVDLELKSDAQSINFLVLNKNTEWQTADMSFQDLDEHSQIFIRMGEDQVYTNPYFVKEEGLLFAEVLSDKIELTYDSIEGLVVEDLLNELDVTDKNGDRFVIEDVVINEENGVVEIIGNIELSKAPYTITHNGREATAMVGWRLKDEMYGYDGDLGAMLHADGTADIKVWSPSADQVSIILYDKDNPESIVKDGIAMSRSNKGVWSVQLNKDNTGLTDVTGYFYHYNIERDGEEVIALDPYAKSMAAWNSEADDSYVGKAAIVNPSEIGPELDYAKIDGFEKREDAIIYEAHVRDMTSDPSIDEELTARFGTFAAFVERLDYIQDLGVTHIQLLPIMSYYFSNEFENDQRLLDYSSTGNNYNWGYDPHSYFSITGMYSENPMNPEKRIEELKLLIDEIHKRDMGVILDVVYNHTARVHIFEDLEPNYYHFMNADGTPRESFGGGRLGTTHKMAQRILVDSITYWTEEFKVDGFRFDMMGDHDAETIEIAFNKAKELNPNILMIGEGWVTYAGDENYPNVQPADQSWMQHTDTVGVFSDEIRNELKSGFGSEGQPRFLTGGARNVENIYQNIIANPGNFKADDPGDVVQYIAAHDNLTLHDVIAQSIKKDPKDHSQEIHQRIRLGNLIVLTAQGTPFIHAGQEYGRTKQFRHEDYKGPVAEAPYKSTYMTDADGNPFEYPYFIHDSYDSTDAINKFEWEKATNSEQYPIHTTTRAFTKGLIELRRSTSAFSLDTREEIDQYVKRLNIPEIEEEDLVVAYQATDPDTEDHYYVFVNADNKARNLSLSDDIYDGDIIVAGDQAGIEKIDEPNGVTLTSSSIEIAALSSVVVRVSGNEEVDKDDGGTGSDREDNDSSPNEDVPSNPSNEADSEKNEQNEENQPDSNQNEQNEEGQPDSNQKSNEESETEDAEENKLPKTATNTFLLLLLGCLSLAFAGILFAFRKKVV
ncbi:secreted pullulanase [Gracilibacillus halotolerans]|uniref:pullulanase n=1 Tax=Gracilibacillus halotolerans TaxID=74386 RepID=A0A841RJU2_9BACI|nr:pullulanase [Gracilibacillus halotolerans]MBB6512779.1 secreted pullulanase [Gracilibacillus halotolerans]